MLSKISSVKFSLAPEGSLRLMEKLSLGITGKKVVLINPPLIDPITINIMAIQIASIGKLKLMANCKAGS